MIAVREEWHENDFYTITIENSIICFGIIQDRCHTQLYYELDDLNSEYYIEFTVDNFTTSVSKLDTGVFALLIDTLIDVHHYRLPIDEAYMLMHQLFAKCYTFEKEADLDVDEIGHTLGYEDDLFSIELKFGGSFHNRYLFHKNFYHEFFSTAISTDFTAEILSKIPQKFFFEKIYSYYIQNEFDKADPLEIERILKSISRKEKIASILTTPEE